MAIPLRHAGESHSAACAELVKAEALGNRGFRFCANSSTYPAQRFRILYESDVKLVLVPGSFFTDEMPGERPSTKGSHHLERLFGRSVYFLK